MLLASLLAVAFPGGAEANETRRARCLHRAALVVGHALTAENYNVEVGTVRADIFEVTAGRDLLCGLRGADRVSGVLGWGDIFIGGKGRDRAGRIAGGHFAGGHGRDRVGHLQVGKYWGGPGADYLGGGLGGVFDAGRGQDRARDLSGNARYLGGPGDDVVMGILGENARFHGGPGDDRVRGIAVGARFAGGRGSDKVYYLSEGAFIGGGGDDRVEEMWDPEEEEILFSGGAGDDSVGIQEWGTFDGGPDHDRVESYRVGTLVSVEACTPAPSYECP